MNYLASFGRIVSNVREFYNEINSATLTGAIDVVAIEAPDGTITASPFHVRFGKASVLHSREKVVDITVNDIPVPIQMKLGEGGEAFFVDEIGGEEAVELPPNLATSPIPSSAELMRAGIRQLRRHQDHSGSRDSSPEAVQIRAVASDDGFDFSHEATRRFLEEVGASGSGEDRQRSRRRRRARELREQAGPSDLGQGEVAMSRRRANSWPGRLFEICEEPAQRSPVARKHSAAPTASASAPHRRRSRSKGKRSGKHKRSHRPKFDLNSSNGSTQTEQSAPIPEQDESDMFAIDDICDEPAGLASAAFVRQNSDDDTDDEEVRSRAGLAFDFPTPAMPFSHSFPSRRAVLPMRTSDTPHYTGFHPFSDTDITPNRSREGSRDASLERARLPSNYKSDSELNRVGKDLALDVLRTPEAEAEWKWGELPDSTPTSDAPVPSVSGPALGSSDKASDAADKPPNWGLSDMLGLSQFMRQTKKVRHKPESEGIYLDELINQEEMDPKLASLYFPKSSRRASKEARTRQVKRTASLTVHRQLWRHLHKSLCDTGLLDDDAPTPPDADDDAPPQAAEPCIPAALAAPNEALAGDGGAADVAPGPDPGYSSSPGSLDGDLHPPGSPPPKIFFDKSKIQELIADFAMSDCGGVVSAVDAASVARFEAGLISYEQMNTTPSLLFEPKLVVRMNAKYYSGRVAMPMIVSVVAFNRPLSEMTLSTLQSQEEEAADDSVTAAESLRTDEPDSLPPSTASQPGGSSRVSSWFYWGREDGSQDALWTPGSPRHYKKVLRLTSEQLSRLRLRSGQNEVKFSVTTRMQGTAWCTMHLYLWRWDDRIVISDIDGTITKSDVFGQILPQIGHQWAQAGVAKLYNRISDNGYKILYLSARAIGQASMTKNYLRYVRQDELSLPHGPLLLSPSSLISAFHREVIEKKPEMFKIAALNDIIALFPDQVNPFYAGFGNKINDVIAYQAAKVPTSKIFTINHLGELRHELVKGMTTSYCELNEQFVDLYFPTLTRRSGGPSSEDAGGWVRERRRGMPLIPEADDDATQTDDVSSPPDVLRSTFPVPEQYSTFTFWRGDHQHHDLADFPGPEPKPSSYPNRPSSAISPTASFSAKPENPSPAPEK